MKKQCLYREKCEMQCIFEIMNCISLNMGKRSANTL